MKLKQYMEEKERKEKRDAEEKERLLSWMILDDYRI